MSDKKRRDITLGEMQDECDKHTIHRMIINGFCNMKSDCKIWGFCPWGCQQSFAMIDLTDPPRFNEAQMALLKALRGLGFVSIENIGSGGFKTTSEDGKTGLFMALLGIEYGETLDLAELLGKDGESK